KVVVERSGPISRVTLLPSSVELRERRSVRAREESPSEADRYEIVLETNGRRARVWLTEADVEHGILVGRAPKCLDDGLRAILCEDIPRVHVLIRREKDGVYLYDTASTQGTFASGAQVRCVALSDEGTSVRLARVSLRLSWRALA